MSVEVFVTVIVTVSASAGFWDIMKYIISRRKGKKQTVQDEALLALLHDRLYDLLGKFGQQEYVDADDYNNLVHLYNAYRARNGNGLIQRMFEQVSRLPIR